VAEDTQGWGFIVDPVGAYRRHAQQRQIVSGETSDPYAEASYGAGALGEVLSTQDRRRQLALSEESQRFHETTEFPAQQENAGRQLALTEEQIQSQKQAGFAQAAAVPAGLALATYMKSGTPKTAITPTPQGSPVTGGGEVPGSPAPALDHELVSGGMGQTTGVTYGTGEIGTVTSVVGEDGTLYTGTVISSEGGATTISTTAGEVVSGTIASAASEGTMAGVGGALSEAAFTATGEGILADIGAYIFDVIVAVAACIIVTCCTDGDKEKIEICRKYKDKFMTRDMIRGYYMLAEPVVPILEKHAWLKRLTKWWLVDNLIEYGSYMIMETHNKPSLLSKVISKGFLRLCKWVGGRRDSFTRKNGEVV
jgi:hypothetical protein